MLEEIVGPVTGEWPSVVIAVGVERRERRNGSRAPSASSTERAPVRPRLANGSKAMACQRLQDTFSPCVCVCAYVCVRGMNDLGRFEGNVASGCFG